MSLIADFVKELRDYAIYLEDDLGNGKTCDLLRKSADTIEELSAKVARQSMERSSQYYNGGWIDASDCLPTDDEEYLEYFPVIVKGIIDGGTHDGEEIICKGFGKYIDWEREWEVETLVRIKSCPQKVLAWCRIPVYEPKEE